MWELSYTKSNIQIIQINQNEDQSFCGPRIFTLAAGGRQNEVEIRDSWCASRYWSVMNAQAAVWGN